jgi:hypothetical protein
VAASSAHARIGETLEQCIARYGAPVKDSTTEKQAGFVKAGFIVIVQLFDTKADTPAICKVERNALGKSAEMSDNEISQLLEANSGSKGWKQVRDTILQKYWITDDAQLVASYDTLNHSLTIMTKAATERANAKKKADEDKKLNGF